jgi:signal transduction histidine kinase
LVITSGSDKKKNRRYGSIQLRYAMTYVVITLIVLVFLNIYCSEISQMVFYGNKQSSMLEKAQLAAHELESLDIMTTNNVKQALNVIDDKNLARIIVTDHSGKVIYDSVDPNTQYALMPQIISALDSIDIFTWHYDSGVIQAEAAVTIVNYDMVAGCLYIMEYDTEQGKLISTLETNIFGITLILEVLIILFSVLYAISFSGRLRKIAHSMRIIQQGDYTHKVNLSGHDELTFLGQEVNDLTERLQISESKRHQFVSDASHELKTPLASIKLLSDSILQYDMDTETVREFVTDIGNEAERLNRMTQKLLALTKGDAGSDYVEREIIYIVPTLQRVIKMLSGIAENSQITVYTEIEEDIPVLVQEDDLYQIMFNLVENGIKYNTPGGKLFVSLRRREDMAILQVRDTGVGIPEDAVGHVFERFYRVDKARSRQTGGSGLGLAIVRSMVERNGGEIRLESKLGEGSVFTVEFPSFDTEEVEQ